MIPVFNQAIDVWVHSGSSGFTGMVVDHEMHCCDYYHHRPLAGSVPIIVDVGGHIGIFSREMARRYPAARIFTVEPVPENAELAQRNLAPFPNVTVLQAAITYEENVVLHRFKDGCNSGGSQLLPAGEKTFENNTQFETTFRVEKLTLERLMRLKFLPQIDLLKLDCEGSEYSILSKCPVLDRVAEIVGEWHKVPGIPRFDEFCRQTLPKWKLETFGPLDALIGMFRLIRPA